MTNHKDDDLPDNPWEAFSPPDGQPIREADNTREFKIRWHAGQLAQSFAALAAPGEDSTKRLTRIASMFAVGAQLSNAEYNAFLDAVIAAEVK